MASWTLTGTTTSPTYWKVRAVVTEQSQDVANNTTSLKVSFQLGRDVVSSYLESYSTNWYINIGSNSSGTQTLARWDWNPATAGTWKEIASRTVTITHDADGTKKNLSISCKWFNTGVTPSEATVSGSVTLTTIPRATTPETPINVTLGSSATIALPRASATFTHNLTYTFGNASGTVATGAGASASWTPPLDLARQLPESTSGTGTITCKTYSNGTLIGTKSVSFKATVPTSVRPTATVTGQVLPSEVYTQFGAMVQGKTRLKIDTTAAGSYGSKIKKISITTDGKTYTGASVTTSPISTSGTLTGTITVTDSRNRTPQISPVFPGGTVLAYSAPTGRVTAARANADGTLNPNGTYMKYTYRFSISPANNRNTHQVILQYKRTSASSWENLVTNTSDYSVGNTSGTSENAILNADYPYQVRLRITDYFSTVNVYAAEVPTGYTTVDYLASGHGVAFGKVAETEDLFDCAMSAKFRGSIVDADGSPINWLHAPIAVADGDNLNSKTLPGLYYRISGSVSNITNFPSGESEFFYMLVTRETSGANAGFVLQRLLFYRVGREYVRRKTSGSDGSWQSWVCISGVDVVVERGASGDWTYEKWRSGKIVAETSGSQSVSFSTQFGSTGLYRGTLSLSHPSGLFSSIASRELVPNAAYIFFTGGLATSSDASKSDFFVYRTSGTATIYYYCRIVGT